jgi:CheY-like chemotaxis protein
MPGGSETILLVEDDPRLRSVASARLRGLGYQVIEAENGANALTLARGSSRNRDDFYRFRHAGRHERQ